AGDLRVAGRMGGSELPAGAEAAHQAALLQASEGPGVMARDETFLGRWSRLKRGQEQQPEAPAPVPAPAKPEAAPELPSVEKLTPESDFSVFMDPRVQDSLRRVALKKLFADPHFNTADPFEPFSGDWTVAEPVSEELLARLNQART